jgi:hypothetical protein
MDPCTKHPRDDADGDRAITADDQWYLSGPKQALDGLGYLRCDGDDLGQILRGPGGVIRPPANQRQIAMVAHVKTLFDQQLEESLASRCGGALLLTWRSSPGA